MKESNTTARQPTPQSRPRTIGLAVTVAAASTAAVALSVPVASGATAGAPAASLTGARQQSAAEAGAAQATASALTATTVAANMVAEDVESDTARDHLSGFAGVEVSPTRAASVTVYWHGAVPATLPRSVATDAAGVARALPASGGITIHFKPAPYTRAQLAGLRAAVNNSPGFASSGISSLGFYPQATGLLVNVDNRADLAKVRRLAALAHAQVAVRYAVAPVTQLSLPGRFRDTPPFLGGIFMAAKYPAMGYECSSGFGMHYANRKGAPYFLATAAHCAARGELRKQRFWAWGNREGIGVSFSFEARDDTVSLYTATPYGVKRAGGGARIYVGNTSRTSVNGQRTAPVRGSAPVVSGDLVNTSGAFSGERTSIRVVTTEMEWTGETPDGFEYRVFGAEAIKENRTNAAGQGDSGGPVYFFYNGRNDKDGVRAAGIISVGFDGHYAACTGLQGRKCFWDIGFPLMTGTPTSIEREMDLAVNVQS
ncbi:MAG TPA: hypothetical protein VMU95_26510 [Trebonia sp.]|nr:hypothetical protein [Trebonia sp.]